MNTVSTTLKKRSNLRSGQTSTLRFRTGLLKIGTPLFDEGTDTLDTFGGGEHLRDPVPFAIQLLLKFGAKRRGQEALGHTKSSQRTLGQAPCHRHRRIKRVAIDDLCGKPESGGTVCQDRLI